LIFSKNVYQCILCCTHELQTCDAAPSPLAYDVSIQNFQNDKKNSWNVLLCVSVLIRFRLLYSIVYVYGKGYSIYFLFMLHFWNIYWMGSRFWHFNMSHANLDWEENFEIKLPKAFYFVFKSSDAKMSFGGPKKVKSR
jgi:hypothetical protein